MVPPTPQTILGIDLTSSEKKPTACAVLDPDRILRYVGFQRTDGDMLDLAARHRPGIVAIDAPLGFPRGMDCLEPDHGCASVWPDRGRRADREVIARKISIYVITKRTFIKRMVYRAIQLAETLEGRGHQVIEVYPYASKVRLFGKSIPKKTSLEGRRFLHSRLSPLVSGLDDHGRLNHDKYDAIVAAYTGHLASRGETEALGEPDEGQIVIPGAAAVDI